MSGNRKRMTDYRSDERGSTVVVFSLALPILLTLVFGVVDFASVSHQRSQIQAAADAAALAAAKAMVLAEPNTQSIEAIAIAVGKSHMASRPINEQQRKFTVTPNVQQQDGFAEVTIRQEVRTYLGDMIGAIGDTVDGFARAVIVGRPHICVLGLHPSDGGTVTLEKNSKLLGNKCVVYSNSAHPDSIKAKEDAKIEATLICSAGGSEGKARNFDPGPTYDCPFMDDPFGSRPAPYVGSCTSPDKLVIESDRTLSPGVYCGGIEIKKNAEVTLQSGVYIIKNGELVVADDATLKGVGVGFYFHGSGSKMMFDRDTTISLEAPENGIMAGILIFSDRNQDKETYKILSNNARNLLGTIYLPNSELFVETEKPVADKSTYTSIIARTVKMIGEPTLVLNSNYDDTNVPAPDGMVGVDTPVHLKR